MKNFRKIYRPFLFAIMLACTLPTFSQEKDQQTSEGSLQLVQQKYLLDPGTALLSRVSVTPPDALQIFQDAGMSPTEHPLSTEELQVVAKAFDALPPLHRRVLQQRLRSISFLDNMPNTALTSPITADGEVNLYHISFRAGILHETISEWATEKERTCFAGGDSSITVNVEAGTMPALTYVLLHEGTHVVDGSLHLISDTLQGMPHPNKFTAGFAQGIWKNINTFDRVFKDSLAAHSRFRRGGGPYRPAQARDVYNSLSQSPFVSLYSTASWHEDLAELLTVYHLTQHLSQPFRVEVRQHGRLIYRHEPSRNPLVRRRGQLLAPFYAKS